MKIEKLMTLSGMIKHVDSVFGDYKYDAIECWSTVWEYNLFLERELTRDMFHNFTFVSILQKLWFNSCIMFDGDELVFQKKSHDVRS